MSTTTMNGIVKHLESLAPGRKVLVLAENEISYYRKNDSLNSTGSTGSSTTKSLRAVIADTVEEVVFNKWKYDIQKRIGKTSTVHERGTKNDPKRNKDHVQIIVHNDNDNDNDSTENTTIVDVQLIHIYDIIKELKRGTPYIVDLVTGIDFSYKYDDHDRDRDNLIHNGKLSSTSATTTTAIQFKIHHQTQLWMTLRSTLLQQSDEEDENENNNDNVHHLYGIEYARTCAYILLQYFRVNKDYNNQHELTPEIESYVRLMNDRVFRCRQVRNRWNELKKYDFIMNDHQCGELLSVTHIKSMSIEYISMIHDLSNEGFLEKNNLRHCNDCILNNFTSLIEELRLEEIDHFLSSSKDNVKEEVLRILSKEEEVDLRNKEVYVQKLFDELNIPFEMKKVALVVRTGSYLYNLHTSRSDQDYTILYFNEIEEVFFPSSKVPTFFSKKIDRPFGSDKAGEIEYECCEIMRFLSDCCMGSPNAIDLLFVDPKHVLYCSKEFHELRKKRSHFLTKQCISKYFGIIKGKLEKAKEIAERNRTMTEWDTQNQASFLKHLYYAFFRIFEVKRVLIGEDPLVRLEEDSNERQYIMKIRELAKEENDFDKNRFNPSLFLKEADALFLEISILKAKSSRPLDVDLSLLASLILQPVKVR